MYVTFKLGRTAYWGNTGGISLWWLSGVILDLDDVRVSVCGVSNNDWMVVHLLLDKSLSFSSLSIN